METIR
jgi:hypothetical protein